MFGADPSQRLKNYLETIRVLQQAWTGESFEYQGRTLRVAPTPVQKPGPQINMGGSTDKAAMRAAKMGFSFMPGFPPHYELYKEALRQLGKPEPPPLPNQGPNFLYVTDNPARDWPIVGPYAVYTMNVYARWGAERSQGATLYDKQMDLESAQRNPLFQFVTPEQCANYARTLEPHGELTFQPLFGGLPPQLAWKSLKLFEAETLPRLKAMGLR
jgi:hypothetical protein